MKTLPVALASLVLALAANAVTPTPSARPSPPTFYQTPFGYHDQIEIRRVLEEAGFRDVRVEVVPKVGGASRPEDTAQGLVHGNPVAVAISERDPSLLPVITDAVAAALKKRFGETEVRAPMQAIVAEARA